MQQDGLAGLRSVIPRWRPLDKTPAFELRSSARRAPASCLSADLHEQAVESWEHSKSLVNAAEVVDGALIFGLTPKASEAAKQILSPDSEAMPLTQRAAKRLLDQRSSEQTVEVIDILESGPDRQYKTIRRLKQRLRLYPRDAITAMEIARLQSTIGQTDRARSYVERALGSAPDNRYVLRSATRFFLHSSEKERALHTVQNSDAVRSDPWVQAAEVAVCTLLEKSPRWGAKEIRSLSSATTLGVRYSELAAGLATHELKHGNRRMARKLLEKSLFAPTENVLAQAIWLETREHIGLREGISIDITPRAFEAGVLKAIDQHDAKIVIDNARGWFSDEPFSLRPAMIGSYYCAAHFGSHEAAISFADRGLRANPNHPALLNNKLVSLASIGRIDEALVILRLLAQCRYDPDFRVHYLAAQGIIAFRSGHIDDGRRYYSEAVQAAHDSDNSDSAFLACAYWLEQEATASVDSQSYIDEAIELVDSEIIKGRTKIRDTLVFTWHAMKARIRDINRQHTFEPIVSDRNAGELLKASIIA